MEADESPRVAAEREGGEELGIEFEVGDLLCVHYCHGVRAGDDGVMFVFDAGTTSLEARDFSLPADELRSARFVPPSELGGYLTAVMTRRILAAIDAARDGRPAYLER